MSLLKITDHADLRKTRKSLYFSSIFTLLVANANLSTDQINVFGLIIIVDQADIITVGKMATLFLLVVFGIHAVDTAINGLRNTVQILDKKWDTKIKAAIANIENEMNEKNSGPPMDFSDLEPWDQNYHSGKHKRTKREEKLKFLHLTFVGLKSFILDYLLVLFIALIACFQPGYLSFIVDSYQIAFPSEP